MNKNILPPPADGETVLTPELVTAMQPGLEILEAVALSDKPLEENVPALLHAIGILAQPKGASAFTGLASR